MPGPRSSHPSRQKRPQSTWVQCCLFLLFSFLPLLLKTINSHPVRRHVTAARAQIRIERVRRCPYEQERTGWMLITVGTRIIAAVDGRTVRTNRSTEERRGRRRTTSGRGTIAVRLRDKCRSFGREKHLQDTASATHTTKRYVREAVHNSRADRNTFGSAPGSNVTP